jgi:hypothetical protein
MKTLNYAKKMHSVYSPYLAANLSTNTRSNKFNLYQQKKLFVLSNYIKGYKLKGAIVARLHKSFFYTQNKTQQISLEISKIH